MVERSIHAKLTEMPSDPEHSFVPNKMKKVKNSIFSRLWVITANIIKKIPLSYLNEKI